MTRSRLNVIFWERPTQFLRGLLLWSFDRIPNRPCWSVTIYIIWFHKTEEKNMFSLVCFVRLRRVSFLSCCWLYFVLLRST